MYGIYLCVSRFVSRRAGLFAALVTATSPLYSLVARQAMTDMAFVGPMTMALALGALALFDDEDTPLPRREARLGPLKLSWPDHPLLYLAAGLFTAVALPQLIVNTVQLRWTFNLGHRLVSLPGVLVMLPYIAGFLAYFGLIGRLRTRAPLYLNIAATLCGLATLAKGIAGLGLPVIVFLAYLGFTWNWKRLRRAQLGFGILLALLTVAVVAVPWHHAMLVRHGKPFWDELYGDNHWRRLVVGRHGDRGTFEYFLRELGYGMWPWVVLAPAALGWAVLRRPQTATAPATVTASATATATDLAAESRKQQVIWLGAIWFVSSYALVSLSMTKFHHYVLPAIPGLAIVVGCFIDDLIARKAWRTGAAALLVGLPLLLLITLDLTGSQNAAERFLWLFSYDYVQSPVGRPWPPSLDFSTALIVFAIVFAAGSALLVWPRAQRVGLWLLPAAAVAFTFYVLDDFMPKVAPFWSQKGPIATYYQRRRSPDERLCAYMLYWRGETFYTSNEIYEGPTEERTVFDQEGADDHLKEWIAHHRGRRAFFIFEHHQQTRISQDLPPEVRPSFLIVDETNNKFSLAQADL
jgi:4-amino-4-deoxy-L-arabinose transferase-like glycosyltransferase